MSGIHLDYGKIQNVCWPENDTNLRILSLNALMGGKAGIFLIYFHPKDLPAQRVLLLCE